MNKILSALVITFTVGESTAFTNKFSVRSGTPLKFAPFPILPKPVSFPASKENIRPDSWFSRNQAKTNLHAFNAEVRSSALSIKERGGLLLQLARFRFLAYSPLEYCLGVAMAQFSTGLISCPSPLQWIHGLVLVSTVHAMTHFFNEFHDYETDRRNLDTDGWTGGSGVLPKHPDLLNTSLLMGWIFVALCVTLVAALKTTFEAKLIGYLAILLSWQYSAPPLRLNGGIGVGEVIVALVLTVLVPSFGYAIGGGNMSRQALGYVAATIAPLFLKAASRQLMMNVPDIAADLYVNKRNICGRIGSALARRVFALGTTMPYVFIWVTSAIGSTPVLVAALQTTTLPVALVLARASLSKDKTDSWLAKANIPFLASANLQLFNMMAFIGFHFSQKPSPSLAFLSPIGIFAFATIQAVMQVLGKAKDDPTVSLCGWRPHITRQMLQGDNSPSIGQAIKRPTGHLTKPTV